MHRFKTGVPKSEIGKIKFNVPTLANICLAKVSNYFDIRFSFRIKWRFGLSPCVYKLKTSRLERIRLWGNNIFVHSRWRSNHFFEGENKIYTDQGILISQDRLIENGSRILRKTWWSDGIRESESMSKRSSDKKYITDKKRLLCLNKTKKTYTIPRRRIYQLKWNRSGKLRQFDQWSNRRRVAHHWDSRGNIYSRTEIDARKKTHTDYRFLTECYKSYIRDMEWKNRFLEKVPNGDIIERTHDKGKIVSVVITDHRGNVIFQ